MPGAIVKKGNQIDSFVAPLAGALTGMVEGEKYNESVRQFDETLGLEKTKVANQASQWTEQMEFSYQQLAAQKEDNRLNRDQLDRFEIIRDKRDREMQVNEINSAQDRQVQGQQFQTAFTRDIEQPFQADQNERERAVQRRGQDKTYSASVYATRKNFEANMTGLADERAKLQSQMGTPIKVFKNILGGMDYATLDPASQNAAIDRMVEEHLGVSRVRGGEGVVQASPEEIAKTKAMYADLAQNNGQRTQDYYNHLTNLAQTEAMVRNGAQVGMQGTYMGGDIHFLPPEASAAQGTWNAQTYGSPEIDVKWLPEHQKPVHSEIMMLLAEAADEAQFFPSSEMREKYLVNEQYAPELSRLLAKGEFSRSYATVYNKMLENAVVGYQMDESSTSGMDELVIPDNQEVAGPR